MKPNCLKCKLLCIADYGYSDWTVKGTTISCLKERFDNQEKFEDYEKKEFEDQRGLLEKAADGCPFFKEGEPLELNVDSDQQEEREKRVEESK